jgi:hypothetical protein
MELSGHGSGSRSIPRPAQGQRDFGLPRAKAAKFAKAVCILKKLCVPCALCAKPKTVFPAATESARTSYSHRNPREIFPGKGPGFPLLESRGMCGKIKTSQY